MLPAFAEMLELLSDQDREVALACTNITNAPPQWDIILGTNLSPQYVSASVATEFTFSSAPEGEALLLKEITILLSGRGEDGAFSMKLVIQHPGSSSMFVYLYDVRRRSGLLVDVNFLRHSATLQAGEQVA